MHGLCRRARITERLPDAYADLKTTWARIEVGAFIRRAGLYCVFVLGKEAGKSPCCCTGAGLGFTPPWDTPEV